MQGRRIREPEDDNAFCSYYFHVLMKIVDPQAIRQPGVAGKR